MLVGRAGLSPIMVGRAKELDRLRGLIGSTSQPSVALIAGEAGIGKTRLVQELVETISAGTLVLAGQADPGTVGRPMELLRDALRHTDVSHHAELVGVVNDSDRSAEQRVCAGVELVRQLVGGQRGLVVFEDLHWADSESLDIFELLAEPDGGSLLVVGTYRPDGLSRKHPAADLLPRLERRHSVTHVQLARLSPADVGTFLAAVLHEDPTFRAVDAVHTRTGGNPFFLEELLAGAGDIAVGDLDSAPLPWTVTELVRSQVDGLDPPVRAVVAAASVLGRRVAFDVLAAVTATDEVDLIEHLRVAVDRGLLVETDPDVFSFHHDLAREAVEGGLLGRERRRLHEAALDALLAATSRDHVALVHHARGAGRYDQMVAEARLGAHESLELGSTYQALQLAEMGLSEADDDLDLRAVAARAAWLAGLLDDAAHHTDHWLADARRAADFGEVAGALNLRIRLAYDLGDLPGMVPLTDALIEVVDELHSDEERARAMTFVAQSYMLRDLVDPTCLWADRAHALATANGFERIRVAALLEKGSVLIMEPRTLGEGTDLLQAAADSAEAVGDHVLAARALMTLVLLARLSSKVDEARHLLERTRMHAEKAGFDSLASHARVEALALLAIADGDLSTAIAVLDKGDRFDPGRALTRKRQWLAVLRGGLALEAGDVESATFFTEQAKPTTPRTLVSVLGLDAHVAAQRGDIAATRSALAEFVAAVEIDGHVSPNQLHDIAAAALRIGVTAAELAPLFEAAGFFSGHRLATGHPWHQLLRAQLAEADGHSAEAAELYAGVAESTDAATGIMARHRGTAHVGAARCLIAVGATDEAREHLAGAATHLARWHGWRVDELRGLERRLGIGVAVKGPEALTPREREVAALLGEGLSNAGLAQRLYISPRTAAVHVSNILTKLAMTSRTEVATWAVREGFADDP
jgi:DNA-binding CsgD family transcriptional regulator/tetratricopeptide (TPR) repeat protein